MLENSPNSGSINSTGVKHRRKLPIIVAVLAIAGLAITLLLVSGLLSNPIGQDAWLFKGAYAEYDGSTSVMGYDFGFSVRIEVLDFNATHAYMSNSYKMESNIDGTIEHKNSTWVELSEIDFTNAFSESNMTNTYDATIDYRQGKRTCTVYEYATDGPTVTVYIDKQISWPLKMTIAMNGENSVSLGLDINLADTNIPGL